MTDDIDAEAATRALATGLTAHPEFSLAVPRIERVKVFRGSALRVAYEAAERPVGDRAWDFQNLVIKEYKRLTGES